MQCIEVESVLWDEGALVLMNGRRNWRHLQSGVVERAVCLSTGERAGARVLGGSIGVAV